MPDATRGQVGQTGPEETRPGFDPLQDTMPWIPEDDPVLRELRAWRDEIGGRDARADGTTASEPAPQSRGSAAEPSPTPVPAPRQAARDAGSRPSARRHAAPDDSAPTGGIGDWTRRLAWSAVAGSVREPDVIPEPTRTEHVPPPTTARHGTWSVLPSAPPEPIESEAEFRLATASTVAFPSIDPTDLEPAPIGPPAIVAENLHKTFGDFTAVDDVSFSVPTGQIVALLGPNGAGKTTTVNMLCTLLPPDGGRAEVAGCDVVADAAGVRQSIMLTGQFAALDESLTGRENLILFGRLLGLKKKVAAARADELLEEFSLTAAAGKRVGQYSGGMRRRIDIACGLVTRPKVVFLDEPTTGLDPRSRQDVWTLVEKLRDSGVTILLTTQYLEEADILSDNIVVIDAGRVIAEGTSDELKAATGAAYCEVTPAHPAYLPRLRAKLRDLIGDAADEIDPEALTVSVPAPDGPETLAEVMRRTEAAKIPLADIALRRPSLDEVFLALTGDGKAEEDK